MNTKTEIISSELTKRSQLKEVFRDRCHIIVTCHGDYYLKLSSMIDVIAESIKAEAIDCNYSDEVKDELIRLAKLR